MKKILMGLIVIMVLMLGMTPSLAEDSNKYVVHNETVEFGRYNTLTKAMEGIKENGKGKYIITLIGDTLDLKDIIEIEDGYTITLKSKGDNPYTIGIGKENYDNKFLVSTGGKLIIENIILDGKGNMFNAGINVSGGTLEMNDGIIRGNGSGVHVDNLGDFTMNGGSIAQNTSAVRGGGVSVYQGTFTMNGGSIIENTLFGEGGGVSVSEGIFIMSGGIIAKNTAGNKGGGIYLRDNSTFTMSDGEISGNIGKMGSGGVYLDNSNFNMSGGKISGNIGEGNGGGGVCLDHESKLTMSGGEISGNTDCSPTNIGEGNGGGGVYLDNNSNFSMSGGKISGNTSDSSMNYNYFGGGGVFVRNGTFTMNEGNIVGNTAILGGGVFIADDGTFIMKNGNISENIAIGDGGGVYVSDGNITMKNGNITGNTAIDGGGIYTMESDYSNIETSENIIFSENTASNGLYNPPKDLSGFSNIKFSSTSAEELIEPNHPLNNWDINYTEGEEVLLLELVYDANGGNGKFTTTVASKLGHIIKSPTEIGITRDGYTLLSWNTEPDGTGTPYVAGVKLNITKRTTLYAQWGKTPVNPPTTTIKDITLVGGKGTLSTNVENLLNEFDVNRLSGKDRYETSVQVSKAYKNSSTVVLASGEKYTDELTATVLANKLNAPILLSTKDKVPTEVLSEIERLGAKKVIIVGETGTISKKVEKQLSIYTLERIGGKTRYETAILLGEKIRKITGKTEEVILVDGTNFPDAIAMTSMGVEEGIPILLTEPSNLRDSTAKTIKDWKISKVTIGGGTVSVGSSIEDKLKETIKVDRIKGADRYETSVLVAKQVYKNPVHAVVASGEVFPDAIVGAPYAAKNKYPIVLSRGNSVPQVVLDYVNY